MHSNVRRSLKMNLLPGDAAYTCSKEMLAAVGALVDMQCIVRMMQQICSGVVFEQRDKVGMLKKVNIGNMATTWWTTLRTLLAHRCWRFFPNLAMNLPEILLGGRFNGVKLQNESFLEPGHRGARQVETGRLATPRQIPACHARPGTAHALGKS